MNAPISICIVNHNGRRHLTDTLPGLQTLAPFVDEILLLDNASSDRSQDLFQEWIPNGRIVQLPDNRSPGAARSAGFAAARNDLVLFADNDIRLTAQCVSTLADSLQRSPRAVIAMPRVVLSARPDRIQYEGAFCHFLGHMILRREDAPLATVDPPVSAEREIVVDSLISACFMIDRSRWKDPMFFDPGYSFYYEDHDVGVRARLSGADLLAVPQAVVLHGTGTPNLSFRPGGSYSARRVRTLIEGRWRHLLKNMAGRSLFVLAPMLLVYELAQFAGVIAKGWLPHWWHAVKTTLGSWRSIRTERRRIQRTRRMPDRILLRGGPLPFKPELTQGRRDGLALQGLNAITEWYWRAARRLL